MDMKNESSANGSYAAKAEETISENLKHLLCAEASVRERRYAHIRERARLIALALKAASGAEDIMDAVAHFDGSSEIYGEMKGKEFSLAEHLCSANVPISDCLSEYTKKLDDLYLCKSIAAYDGRSYSDIDAVKWLSEHYKEDTTPFKDRKVSFVRGSQSGKAFERFARFIPGVLAEYEEDFKSACEAVAAGEANYAIIPVENSTDGRLHGFYRLIEKYSLSIVLSATVLSDDGEVSTKFALVYKSFDIIGNVGSRTLEFRITLADQGQMGNIILAANFFGADVLKIYSLPISSVGRENSFGITLAADGADIAGLLCYLFLEYPQFFAIGLYRAVEE